MSASQVFYRKWRPQTLAEVVGQAQVTQTLLNALKSGRVSHAYLFCGPRGTGKTSTGRILAKAVNCLTSGKGEPCNTCQMCQGVNESRAPDVIEIDAASNTGVDDIRNLRERVNYAPNQARFKVYIIDEVHMLSTSASNALLKTLEEPPPYVIFVLATTEAHKVLPTIQSRCQRFDFRRLTQTDIAAKLAGIAKAEGIQIQSEALRLVARSAAGSLRDAENLLEQLTTYYGTDVTLQQAQTMLGITGDWRAKELAKHLVHNDITAGITTINSVNADGLDLRQFNRELVEYLRGLLLVKTGAGDTVDLTAEEIAELKALASKASLPQILKAVKTFGQINLSFDNYSTLPLELALVDCIVPEAKKEAHPADPETPRPVRMTTPPPAPTRPAPAVSEPKSARPVSQAVPPVPPRPAVAKTDPVAAKPEPPRAVTPSSAPKPAAASAPPPGSESDHLRTSWRQIIDQAPEDTRRTPAMAILRSAGVTLTSIDGDAVVLAFKYPIHKSQIEKPENQQTVEKIIGKFLGRACRVRCVHEPESNHLVKAALKMGAQITKTEEK